MEDTPQNTTNAAVNDIIFECPYCERSLAIDVRGAGLIITCPDCQKKVQVPGLPPETRLPAAPLASADPQERIRVLSEQMAISQAKVERLVASLEEVRERRRYLEKLRADNMARFEQIGKELVIVQNALDRIVGVIEDASAERLAPAPSAEAPPETTASSASR